MLDVDNALPFLFERGLIDPAWVVDGDLTIRSVACRNQNLSVEGPGGVGCFIRQADPRATSERRTLAAEASFYEFCQEEPAVEAVSRFLPRMLHRDRDRSLHVLERIHDSANLRSSQTEPYPTDSCHRLGEAMGTLHRVFRLPGLGDDPRLSWLSRGLPWVFKAHRPWPGLLADMTPAGVRVLEIIQSQPQLETRLDRLGAQWRPETVIHGDIKSTNVLIRLGEIRLIDWEFVQVGDPSWDLAGALHDVLLHWTMSMPSDPHLGAEERIARARFPLEAVRPAVRALWEGYRSSSELDFDRAEMVLSRAVVFSAARLIQTALEFATEQMELTALPVILLQLSANLLENPFLGRVHLYGLPLGGLLR